MRRGAGAYICGEETALFNSIEGYRGEPRNKPPFPVERGLFGKPTVDQQRRDAGQRARTSSLDGGAGLRGDRHRGLDRARKLFCVSGHVERPGAVRGAVRRRRCASCSSSPAACRRHGRCRRAAGRRRRAASCGRTSSTCRSRSRATRAAATTLGSGVVMVVRRHRRPRRRSCCGIAAFFRDESCGQCVPCRVGTVRQEEALARLVAGDAARHAHDGAARCSPRSAR